MEIAGIDGLPPLISVKRSVTEENERREITKVHYHANGNANKCVRAGERSERDMIAYSLRSSKYLARNIRVLNHEAGGQMRGNTRNGTREGTKHMGARVNDPAQYTKTYHTQRMRR